MNAITREGIRMNTNKSNQSNHSSEQHISTENLAAKIALIAAIVTVLGDSLAAVAAAIALQEAEQTSSNENSNGQLEKIQKQIDSLTQEVKQLKRLSR